MLYRVTNSSQTAVLSARINAARHRVDAAQGTVSSGKRINSPSDDPLGAEAVIKFRTSLASVEQFQQNGATVRDGLQSSDSSMESYQLLLDRANVLMSQGASEFSSVTARASVAQELEGIRTQMMTIANTKVNDRFLFGGTRQNAPPFDATGTPAVTPAASQMVQIEQDSAPIAAGVLAEGIFSNSGGTVFANLATAAAAMRGTGDPVADKAAVFASMDTMVIFSNQSEAGRAQLGASFNSVDGAATRLESQSLSFQGAANRFELADLAEAAIELTQSSNALQATLQATAYAGKGSLMDLLA